MITFKRDIAYLGEQCPVEDAEELFAWLITKPMRKVDASNCQEIHTAVLQTLLLCRPKLVKLPHSVFLQQALNTLVVDI
jgi:hypothetical protein